MRYIRSKTRGADRVAIVPQTLEHIIGSRSLIGVLPLRYFGHLLVIVLAVGVAVLGNLGRNSSSLAAFSFQAAANSPSVFTQAKAQYEDDFLVKPPAPETSLVNRPREGIISHTVVEGETVASIAEKYGISTNTILWANNLDENDVLTPGQVLQILPVSGVLHKVKQGEKIEDIAWKYQSDVRAIIEFNQLTDPDHLEANDVLVVPGGRLEERERPELASRSSQRPAADAVEQPKPQALKPQSYKVAEGDTLSGIADKFGISQDTIIAANNLGNNPDLLSPGQELTILPVSGALHAVQKGESITAIASAYGVSAEEIVKANGLSDANVLSEGQKLVIPGAKAVAARSQPAQAAAVAVPSVTHVVQSGESLRLIAEMYNVNPAKIVEANGIQDADVVTIGQKLVIPGGQLQVAAAPQPASSAPAPAPAPAAAPAPAPAPAPKPAPPPPPAPAPKPPSNSGGWNIVAVASKYLGYSYVWGGTSPSTGFDCSGFVYYVFRAAGVPVPRDLWGQLQAGPRIKQANLQPGDIVFFENTYTPGLSHDGIYIGNGRFINAASEREGVRVSSLSESYWAARYYGASRPW